MRLRRHVAAAALAAAAGVAGATTAARAQSAPPSDAPPAAPPQVEVIARPAELQTGIVLAAVGAPFFVVLVRRLRMVRL